MPSSAHLSAQLKEVGHPEDLGGLPEPPQQVPAVPVLVVGLVEPEAGSWDDLGRT